MIEICTTISLHTNEEFWFLGSNKIIYHPIIDLFRFLRSFHFSYSYLYREVKIIVYYFSSSAHQNTLTIKFTTNFVLPSNTYMKYINFKWLWKNSWHWVVLSIRFGPKLLALSLCYKILVFSFKIFYFYMFWNNSHFNVWNCDMFQVVCYW